MSLSDRLHLLLVMTQFILKLMVIFNTIAIEKNMSMRQLIVLDVCETFKNKVTVVSN